MRFHRLLVPHDFSQHADRALKFAATLAGPAGKILVLHVVTPIVPTVDFASGAGFDIPIDELVASARQELVRVVARASSRRSPKMATKVEVGDPYGRIIGNARGMDAIVMSTTGRTGLSHLMIGSVAEKVVRHSPVPVLTLRPGGAARHPQAWPDDGKARRDVAELRCCGGARRTDSARSVRRNRPPARSAPCPGWSRSRLLRRAAGV
jgi:nucleotide-binding universal stress UspA family protein